MPGRRPGGRPVRDRSVATALPPGGIVTFTLDAIVTAASGTVSITATLTLPAGFTDTNTANNSATDTDSVTAAPISADLAVTKSDGVTELLPGSVTTLHDRGDQSGTGRRDGRHVDRYGAGGTDIRQLDVRRDGRLLVRGGGAGNLSTPVSLLAGGTATFSVPATVAGDAPASIANTAIATVPERGDRSGAREQQGHGCGRGGAAAKPGRRRPRRRSDSRRTGRVRSALFD